MNREKEEISAALTAYLNIVMSTLDKLTEYQKNLQKNINHFHSACLVIFFLLGIITAKVFFYG